MRQVTIDRQEGRVEVDGKQIPTLILRMIQGSVGKLFVVKHYRGKKRRKRIVVTRYPDMSGIVASEKQKVRRDLFREAVVYARWIVGDEERKQAFKKTLPWKKRKQVYQAAIQLYMRMQGDQHWLRKQLAVKAMMGVEVERTQEKESSLTGKYPEGWDSWMKKREKGMVLKYPKFLIDNVNNKNNRMQESSREIMWKNKAIYLYEHLK